MDLVPESFRAMPRWWRDDAGRAWLDALPESVRAQCARWGLSIDGAAAHGSNALVVPVRSAAGEALALRLAPPGDDVAAEAAALEFWRGCGVVALVEADVEARALLLERLEADRRLDDVPVEEALSVMADLTVRMAIPAGSSVRGTDEIARVEASRFAPEWEALGAPTSRAHLDAAVAAARALGAVAGPFAVNGDLHGGQILWGRAGWTVVDPVLVRGDPEYDLARALWSRLDEVADAEIVLLLEAFARRVGAPVERTRAWAIVRSMSYLLWGLAAGLTEDPPRCRRLLDALV